MDRRKGVCCSYTWNLLHAYPTLLHGHSSSDASSTVVCKLFCSSPNTTRGLVIPPPMPEPAFFSPVAVTPFFLDFACFCHAHNGTKLSKNPTSSNKLGNNQIPGGTANIVIIKRMSRTTAITAIATMKPSNRSERYHTPVRRIGGHKGNKIAPNTTTIIPIPPRIVCICVVS